MQNLSKKQELVLLLEEKDRRSRKLKISNFYPDKGALARVNYPKHVKFFKAGLKYRERCIMAANRVGKTEGIGGYELTLHLTGDYPSWWQGVRFDRPIRAWAAGTTGETVRDIIQAKLLGPIDAIGTGLIPGSSIMRTRPAAGGVPDAIETITIKHSSGGVSRLGLKSYKKGRKSFEGTEQDIIWLDEEPPLDVYTECVTRTMTVNGHILLTFTPLLGLSETVMQFMPSGEVPKKQEGNKFIIQATWDDAPHLTEQQKKELWDSLPPYQRDARSRGVPQLGSGAIYPVPESDIIAQEFEIPEHYPRAYGFDVGWKRTAAIWGAWDRDSDIIYLYSEHYRGQAEPPVHAAAIRGRGDWIKGAIDPAARGRGQKDGEQLFFNYIDLGLDLTKAVNAREAGIYATWERLSTGRLKVFRSLSNWLTEYRIYRRDEKGQVVKDMDHLMDATRYLVMSGSDIAETKPTQQFNIGVKNQGMAQEGGWMNA